MTGVDASKRSNGHAHVLNPRTTSYEFLGPPGTFLISTLVPFFTYVFAYGCSETAGGCPRSFYELPTSFMQTVTDVDWWKAQWDPHGFAAYFAWYAFTVVAWAVLPGEWVEGLPLRTGQKLKYKINGACFYVFEETYCSFHSLSSIRNASSLLGPRRRAYLDPRPCVIYVHLQPLDWNCNRCLCQLYCASFLLLCLFIRKRCSTLRKRK